MLEEALRKSQASPAETALAMTSFLREELPAGAAAAEARFFRLYSLLLDRVFGPILPPDHLHEYGGWLSHQIRWKLPIMDGGARSASMSSPTTTSLASALDRDPVVALLGNILIDAISKEADHRPGVRFPFPFLALPKATQASWLELVAMERGKAIDSTSSENALQLLGALLRVRPGEQTQLRALLVKGEVQKSDVKRPLQLSPGHSMNSPPPATPNAAFKPATDNSDSSPPMVMLSMLEMYLFMFIRYPLASPVAPPQPSYSSAPSQFTNATSLTYNKQPVEHWGEKVYEFLFRQYLSIFLPSTRPTEDARQFLKREGELFIRTVMELWMDSQVAVAPIGKVAQAIQEHRRTTSSAGGAMAVALDLNMSYNLTQGKYEPPPKQVQTGILLLIKRVLADPAIKAVCDPVVASRKEATGLSKAMSILQPSFFNFIRGTLRHAALYLRGSPFNHALEAWLLWLEPWNVTRTADTKKHPSSVTVPLCRSTDRSKYSAQWEPYIFANLHMYTVPLAIFLRRSRELDFSPKDFRYSLAIVQRVFRVFTPQVVDIIQRGLASKRLGGKYAHLVQHHEAILGPHSPSLLGEMALSSCKEDMHCLLEEMYVQHHKAVKELDIVDRFVNYLEGFAGQGLMSGGEKLLTQIVGQARHIVQLPADYEVIPKAASAATTTTAESVRPASIMDDDENTKLERTAGGMLTARSKELVLSGSVKCGLDDVAFFGDPMTRRLVQDHEIEFLVPLTIQLSHWLNKKFGIHYSSSDQSLDSDDPLLLQKLAKETEEVRNLLFRFNLRFLADYRNLVFLALMIQFTIWARKVF